MKKIIVAVVMTMSLAPLFAATNPLAEVSVRPAEEDIFSSAAGIGTFEPCEKRDDRRWCTVYLNDNRVWAIEVTGALATIRVLDPTTVGGGRTAIAYWRYYQEMILTALRKHFGGLGVSTDSFVEVEESKDPLTDLFTHYQTIVHTHIVAAGVADKPVETPRETVLVECLKALSENDWAPGMYTSKGLQEGWCDF